jgi:ubiquinone/menaquinone biosynthesis C-methylase UbiE
MNPEEYDIMYRAERNHWWYLGMERITRALLDRCTAGEPGLRILDAGCGTGAAMTTYLAEYGRVTGFDLSREALRYAALRGARRLVQASVMHIPFPAGSFDLVTSFDVLYERGVQDDSAALREFARVLAPGGHLLLRLPAHDWLRGRHDEAVHSRHRYNRREVVTLLREARLNLDLVSYANMFLFPFVWVKRFGERFWAQREAESDLTLSTGPFNRLLAALLSAEARLVVHHGLPLGSSVVALAAKP